MKRLLPRPGLFPDPSQVVQQLQKLGANDGAGVGGMAGNELHQFLQAATGGLPTFPGNLGPFLLQQGQQGLEMFP